MKITQSKITSQGQISVPARVRKQLGLQPGSTIEWHEEGECIVVRRGGKYNLDDLASIAGTNGQPPLTVDEIDSAISAHLRKKHARD